jgi:hypothetical protein
MKLMSKYRKEEKRVGVCPDFKKSLEIMMVTFGRAHPRKCIALFWIKMRVKTMG